MKSAIYLRIASVLLLLHAVLHTIGGVFGKPAPGAETMVLATMRGYRFPVFGVMRSYADFFRGMGLAVSIFLVIEAIVLWQLASLVKSNGARLRPILASFLVGYLLMALNSFLFFFFPPVIVELLIAACLAVAIYTAGSTDSPVKEADGAPMNVARP